MWCYAARQIEAAATRRPPIYKHRSPTAYAANPSSERGRYPYDTDKSMLQLRIREPNGAKGRGMVSWFACHGVRDKGARFSAGARGVCSAGQLEGWRASGRRGHEGNVRGSNVKSRVYACALSAWLL